MNEHFNWRRLGLLIRNDFLGELRGYLIAFAVVTIMIMLNAIPGAGFGDLKDNLYFGWFTGMLLIWGSIHVSVIFKELNNKKLNEGYLLLPASALEKTLARYLHGSIFFIFYILVYTTLVSLIIEGINQLQFGRSNSLFTPFNEAVWEVIAVFMIIQPIFFLGGAWFRSARWFKTVISVFLLAAGLGVLACIAFLIFFSGEVSGMLLGSETMFENGLEGVDWSINENLGHVIVTGLKLLFYVIAPLFCCYVTWLRVSETQVSHGI